MTRRNFSGLLAGFVAFPGFESGALPSVVTLEAIAGSRLPETLAITTGFPEKLRQNIWELRTYRGAEPALASHLAGVFPRAGIRPLLRDANGENLAYLIPFENLTLRDRAWTAVNADPEWIHACSRFQSYHFGLYRST